MDTEIYSNKTIVESRRDNIHVIRFNKPSRKNAMDSTMYIKVLNILNDAAKDEEISAVVLTGTGDFYSSGNDFGAVAREPDKNNLNILSDYIEAFIRFPKLLVAIVNGPAIGIAATTLALCDLVFASENSYFYTPFTKLGIVAEGCSTFTFPRIIGERKATEMLLFNHKMMAKEALKCGFVNFIYKPEELQSKVWNKIIEISTLPVNSTSLTKKLLKGSVQNQLLEANFREMQALNEMWLAGAKWGKSKM